MPLFYWVNILSVDIKEIDEQHKKLIGILNEFHDAKLAGKDEEVMKKLLNDLLSYTKMHFEKEEKLMLQYEFRDYNAHKLQHNTLVTKATILQTKFSEGDKSILTEVAVLLSDWLAEEIMIYDKELAEYLNSKGVT